MRGRVSAWRRRVVRWGLRAVVALWVPALLSCGGGTRKPVPTERPQESPPVTTVPTAPDTLARGPAEPWVVEPVPPAPEEVLPSGVPVGILAPFSGPYAAYGKSYLDGATLAVEAAEVPGIVRLVPADSEGDAIAALHAVRRLIETENVVTVIGGILSLPTLIAGVEANAHGVPMISNVASEEGIRRIGPWVFHQVPSRSREAQAAAELAVFDFRSFRAAILSPEQGEGRTLATAFTEQFVALGGQVVASETYEEGTTDFNRMVRRIRSSRPDLLYLPVPVEDALLLAPALGFQGIDVPILGTTHWQSDRLLRLSGIDLEGALVPGGLPQEDDGVLEEFERLYTRRFGSEANRFAAAGFIATRRVVAILSAEPDADRPRLQQQFAGRFGGGFDNNAPVPFLIVQGGALVDYPPQ